MRLAANLRQTPEGALPQTPPAPEGAKPLPPQRGTLFEAQAGQISREAGSQPLPSAGQLAREVEGALSRLKLLQFASLPDNVEPRPEAAGREAMVARREFQLELPIVLQNERTSMMQVHVENEARGQGGNDPEAQDWRLSFSLQLGAQGAVNAQIHMRMARFGILLWAEDGELRDDIRANIPRLNKALKEMEIDVVELDIRKFPLPHGKNRPGQMMDASS